MKIPTEDHPTSFKEFNAAFTRITTTNRFIFGFFGFNTIISLIFGMGVWLVTLGFALPLLTLARIYDPAYRFWKTTLRIEGLPKHLPQPHWGGIHQFFYRAIYFSNPNYRRD